MNSCGWTTIFSDLTHAYEILGFVPAKKGLIKSYYLLLIGEGFYLSSHLICTHPGLLRNDHGWYLKFMRRRQDKVIYALYFFFTS